MLDRLVQRRPILTAAGLYALVVALAFRGFWTGQFLVNEMSDMRTGYPFRAFAAQYFRQHGGFPEWSPYIFGGMPFLANTGHGDTFYPTFLLRLLLPVHVGITLGFLVHIALAGLFMFLFLRALRLTWGPAFLGGAAYMFSGQVVSLVSPGHDGKLFVSALLPLALLFLYQAVTRSRWRQYLLFGVVVGFALLSPHFQMTYYLLMAAGFFWLFLVFIDRSESTQTARWWWQAGWFAGALAVGFALAAIQLLPFMAYIPFSPRGEGGASTGWAYATSWAMPPEELLNTLWPAFSGILEHYWGRNVFKLHSEYLGVVTLILATFSLRLEGRRRLVWFFVFLTGYGVLFALGGYTAFYRIPYTLLPGIKLTRAPSMIFFLASFSAAALAGLGLQALASPEGMRSRRGPLVVWGVVLTLGAVLGLTGLWQEVMRGLAQPERQSLIAEHSSRFTVDTFRTLVFGALAIALVGLQPVRRLSGTAWAFALGALVLLDLWSVERHYIRFSPAPSAERAGDALLTRLEADPGLYRVLPGANYLMVDGIRSTLGYHGNELHRYDELLGGKNVWQNLGSPAIWQLLAVRYVGTPSPVESPLLIPVDTQPLPTAEGPQYLYRYRDAAPYARLVPVAIKVGEEQQIQVVLDPRFDAARYLVVPPEALIGDTTVASVPDTIGVAVDITPIRAGAYEVVLTAPAPPGSHLFVSENWHPGWSATVDGRPAEVVRAQHSLIGVPLSAGARRVDLVFRDPSYRRGRLITLLTIVALLGAGLQAWSSSRRARSGTGSATVSHA